MNFSSLKILFLSLPGLFLFAGCHVESISSEYDNAERGYGYYPQSTPRFSHEITDSSVLGISTAAEVSEEQIAAAITKREFSLKPGSRVVLIQSGAPLPDKELIDAVSLRYTVLPMSGYMNTPEEGKLLDKSLRLSAANGGADTVVIVWGVFESTDKSHLAAGVSWLPIVGSVIPDSTKAMRIRLRALVLDVKTGSWDYVIPEVFMSEITTASMGRGYNFAMQKLALKEKAYNSLSYKLSEHFR
jgi:hypothetical protein